MPRRKQQLQRLIAVILSHATPRPLTTLKLSSARQTRGPRRMPTHGQRAPRLRVHLEQATAASLSRHLSAKRAAHAVRDRHCQHAAEKHAQRAHKRARTAQHSTNGAKRSQTDRGRGRDGVHALHGVLQERSRQKRHARPEAEGDGGHDTCLQASGEPAVFATGLRCFVANAYRFEVSGCLLVLQMNAAAEMRAAEQQRCG